MPEETVATTTMAPKTAAHSSAGNGCSRLRKGLSGLGLGAHSTTSSGYRGVLKSTAWKYVCCRVRWPTPNREVSFLT